MLMARQSLILLVDDEPDLLEILALQFSTAGCHACSAPNGRTALDLIIKAHEKGPRIDVIVSDMNMPVMNGLEFLRELRKMGFATPFLFFTGYGDKAKTLEALRLGAYDFFDKPTSPDVLLSAVTEAAKLGRMINELDEILSAICQEFKVPSERFLDVLKAQRELLRTEILRKKF
jgi:CheY-like chemotaxis protein